MKNKLISFILVLILLATMPLSATYKYNPFTRKLDYYEAAGVLGATDAVYFGDVVTDTTWRIVRDGTKLSFLRRESGAYVEKGYFDATSFHSENIYVGNVHLEEEHGCLATHDFHAHGIPPVGGYFKLKQGTTPTAHKEAEHSILWVDSNEKLYLEKADGTDVEVAFAAISEYLQASKGTDQTNFATGEDVIFDTVDISSGSSISLDTSTGRFTLSTGKTYRLTCGVRFEHTSAAKIGFAWYNITGSVELSEHARLDNMSSATDYSTLPVAQAIITPSIETEVTVRCVWEGDDVEDVNAGHTWAIIEVIAGNALYSDVWELSGTDIYYNSGNVGVGEISPDERIHITGNNATVKLEDDGGNFSIIKSGNSQLTLAADPDNAIPSTDIVFDMDGAEVARFWQGGKFEVKDYTMLGSDAPGIKTKKLTGTTAAGGSSVTIVHGLDKSKIIGAQVLVSNDTGNRIPPNFTSVANHEFDFFIDTTNVHIYSIAGNSSSINGNAVTVLLTYEE